KSIEHNLGYKPVVHAFLNDASPSFNNISGANIPLPSWIGLDLDNLVSGAIVQTAFIDVMASDTHVYINLYNGTGNAISALTFTYYLMRLSTNPLEATE